MHGGGWPSLAWPSALAPFPRATRLNAHAATLHTPCRYLVHARLRPKRHLPQPARLLELLHLILRQRQHAQLHVWEERRQPTPRHAGLYMLLRAGWVLWLAVKWGGVEEEQD